MHMVDDLTPYYQDRLHQLAPAQRKIVEFLCLEGKPKTIKEISTPCLMSQQTTAKQVGELDTAGLVTRVRIGRNTYCELSDPLMRFCIQVKDNKTEHFRLFAELLRHWFDAGAHAEAAEGAGTIETLPDSPLLGPRHLPRGLQELRDLLACRPDDGAVGRTLTHFLRTNIGNLVGELADWERALKQLDASLSGLPDCRIPIEMLKFAVRYAKTGDERHLLGLPLEQRQLVEGILPSVARERT